MHENTEFTTARDVEAIQIPSGTKTTIPAGTPGVVTQTLGGSYTIATYQGLARVAEKDLEALGLEKPSSANGEKPSTLVASGPVDEKAVWDQLRQCYDPEIPVNIVDLGLIYDCKIAPVAENSYRADVKMTLTAPGCGMGPVLAQDVQNKLLMIEGVDEANVEVVWDPPWHQSMMTDAARLQLGLY